VPECERLYGGDGISTAVTRHLVRRSPASERQSSLPRRIGVSGHLAWRLLSGIAGTRVVRRELGLWHDVRYTWPVSKSLHVRLDDASSAALDVVRAGAMSDSEAVRIALREAAARRTARSAIQAEVAALAADERDREEMRVIREQLAELAPGD
jgi:hypothetical protein